MQAIAQSRSIEPVDACLDLLEDDPDTSCIGHAMDEDDVRAILADPDVMVASDAIAMSPDGPLDGVPVHPRNYGTFPRVLGPYVRGGALGLEAAVRTMTSLPADRFGLADRGRIVEGARADLVLLDPRHGERSRRLRRPACVPGRDRSGDRQRHHRLERSSAFGADRSRRSHPPPAMIRVRRSAVARPALGQAPHSPAPRVALPPAPR